MWKDNISFILVGPKEPGNIGSSARAIKNMGFHHLSMVSPVDYLVDETQWLAANSYDIVEKAKVYDSLSAALADKTVAVGTTRRTGRTRGLITPLAVCAPEIVKAAERNRIAIVFGREDRGLTNEEIRQCGYLTTIPTSTDQPSLNLAQAVLLTAYELSRLETGGYEDRLVRREELLPLFDRIGRTLKLLGYIPRGDRDIEKGILRNVKNIIGRAGLTDWEINMIHGICTSINGKLRKEKGEKNTKSA